MKMPVSQPHATRHHNNSRQSIAGMQGITPQGCNIIACAGAVAQCISNPNPLQCILNIAPNCADCL